MGQVVRGEMEQEEMEVVFDNKRDEIELEARATQTLHLKSLVSFVSLAFPVIFLCARRHRLFSARNNS